MLGPDRTDHDRAREITAQQAPQLHRLIAQLARQAELPKLRVYVIDTPTTNAFATGRNPKHDAIPDLA